MTVARAGTAPGLRWRPVVGRIRPWAEVLAVYALLLALVVYGSLASSVFHTTQNLENLLRQAIPLGLVAIGQTFVLLVGGIDMSVGSTVKLTVLVGALLMNGRDESILTGVLAVLAIGAGIGLINGLAITGLRAAPFIVTFGVYYVVRGVAFTVSTQPVGLTPPALAALYDATWAGVPIAIAAMAIIWLGAWLVLSRLRLGRHVYAVGGREHVAALSGIHVSRVRVLVYVASGIFAALAGLFTLVVSGLGDPQAGNNLEFLSITAAVVGGVSLFGGRGSLLGTAGGVLLLTAIGNVFDLTQVNPWFQEPILGLIILAAVALYRGRSAAAIR